MRKMNARLPIHSGPRVSGSFEAKRGGRWQAAPFAWNAVSRCALLRDDNRMHYGGRRCGYRNQVRSCGQGRWIDLRPHFFMMNPKPRDPPEHVADDDRCVRAKAPVDRKPAGCRVRVQDMVSSNRVHMPCGHADGACDGLNSLDRAEGAVRCEGAMPPGGSSIIGEEQGEVRRAASILYKTDRVAETSQHRRRSAITSRGIGRTGRRVITVGEPGPSLPTPCERGIPTLEAMRIPAACGSAM